MKKFLSWVLVFAMCCSLLSTASAASQEEIELPHLEEGDHFLFIDGGIMPLEDFGNCPKGHTGPSGYKFDRYYTGQSSGRYDDLGKVLFLASLLTGSELIINITSANAVVLDWLNKHQNPDLTYFKYVYTKSGSRNFNHIIYALHISGAEYSYVTCETGYD